MRTGRAASVRAGFGRAALDETQLPDGKKTWIALNAERAKDLPVVNEQGEPTPGAEERQEKLGF